MWHFHVRAVYSLLLNDMIALCLTFGAPEFLAFC